MYKLSYYNILHQKWKNPKLHSDSIGLGVQYLKMYFSNFMSILNRTLNSMVNNIKQILKIKSPQLPLGTFYTQSSTVQFLSHWNCGPLNSWIVYRRNAPLLFIAIQLMFLVWQKSLLWESGALSIPIAKP